MTSTCTFKLRQEFYAQRNWAGDVRELTPAEGGEYIGWEYFFHFDSQGLERMCPWRLMERQGKRRTLYVHASTFFESMVGIVDYNKKTLKSLFDCWLWYLLAAVWFGTTVVLCVLLRLYPRLPLDEVPFFSVWVKIANGLIKSYSYVNPYDYIIRTIYNKLKYLNNIHDHTQYHSVLYENMSSSIGIFRWFDNL